jgi:hypothetical protein
MVVEGLEIAYALIYKRNPHEFQGEVTRNLQKTDNFNQQLNGSFSHGNCRNDDEVLKGKHPAHGHSQNYQINKGLTIKSSDDVLPQDVGTEYAKKHDVSEKIPIVHEPVWIVLVVIVFDVAI